MKKLLTLLFASITLALLAQSPQSFKYQALLRDKNGILIAEKNVAVRVSILQGSVTGTTVYSETHTAKTSTSGTINLEIGKGNLPIGTFTSIEWGKNSLFVKIEMDPTGGSVFELVGTSQLLSVPYALYAEKSGDEKWAINPNKDISYSAGKVGIGTTIPQSGLDIQGTVPSLGIKKIQIKSTDSENKGRTEIKNDPSDLGIVYSTSLNRIGDSAEDLLFGLQQPVDNTTAWNIFESWRGAGLMVSASGPDLKPLTFGIDRVEKMRLTANGNFGIGKTAPAYTLDVNGPINASQFLINGSPLSAGTQLWGTLSSNIYFNTGKVGIGTTSPISNLDVAGLNSTIGLYKTQFKGTESEGKGRFEIKNDPSDQSNVYSTSLDRIGDSSEELIFGLQQPLNNTNSWSIFESWRGAGLMVSASGPDLAPLTLGIDRVEKVRLATNGNLGIGTPNPKSKLQVENGDIYINSVTSGVIMKSPNGQCWRMTVSNSGVPTFTSITCPQ